jgi:cellulose synthase/poly-beta-1,6-N-acetylglucosamine synthase-like glycosyltransferase
VEALFVIFLFLLVYSYAIYPLIVFCLATVLPNSWQRKDHRPSVSIIISAYNEEAVIESKIRNALAVDYPKELLEIIVGSDGSTDRTNEILSRIQHPCLTFHNFTERSGKTECLNRMVPRAKGEIILFTDANSMFPADLLAKIVRNFADPTIGLVSGWTKYHTGPMKEATTGVYARFDKHLKMWESEIDSCVGADGAIFAIRKPSYRNLLPQDINDFVIPLNVIREGLRTVLDPEVFCIERAAMDVRGEFKRQVRITTRTLSAINRNIDFLNPLRYGFFSFFLFSHKVMRLAAPVFFIALIFLSLAGWNIHFIYKMFLLGQAIFLLSGIMGFCLDVQWKIVEISKLLLVTFAAQLLGWIRMIGGVEDITWIPKR